MAGEVVQINTNSALSAMSEKELVDVLQSSLYPGANINSIKLVIGYCKAANLDPMQKPVHIVPMWDKNAKQMRDVIMPGVGLYRTQASRTNALAGISKPKFGELVVYEFDGKKYTVPDSCEVTVKRLMPNGEIAEYTAEEFWIENYATAGKDTDAPNAMWKKRPRGQLAKCAQAQALRMGFPEMTGSAPTADEMEGKTLETSEIDITPKKEEPKTPVIPECPDEVFAEKKAAWQMTVESGKKTASDLLAMLSTRAAFTSAQQKEILSWKAAPTQPAAANTQSMDDFDRGLDAGGYVPE